MPIIALGCMIQFILVPERLQWKYFGKCLSVNPTVICCTLITSLPECLNKHLLKTWTQRVCFSLCRPWARSLFPKIILLFYYDFFTLWRCSFIVGKTSSWIDISEWEKDRSWEIVFRQSSESWNIYALIDAASQYSSKWSRNRGGIPWMNERKEC